LNAEPHAPQFLNQVSALVKEYIRSRLEAASLTASGSKVMQLMAASG
jgi:hypothetical protein